MSDEGTRGVLTSFIVAIFIFSILQTTSIAEDGGAGYSPIVNIEIIDGAIISDFSTISGTIQNEVAPISATWELRDSWGTRHFVDFTDDLETSSDISSWNLWSFDIEIDPLTIGSCSCMGIVSVEETNGNPFTTYFSIFILPESSDTSPPFDFPPTIQILPDMGSQWFSQTHSIEFYSRTIDSETPIFSYQISPSSIVKCSEEISQLPSEAQIIEPPASSLSVGIFSQIVDINNLPDGWYDLRVFAQTPSNQQFSHSCKSIKIDNNPPVVIIEGPDSISEGMGYAFFDGSSSFDETWGIQGLTYIWSVINSDAVSENGTMVVSGTDERTFSVNTNISGTFSVKLTIADKAGNLGTAIHNLDVTNVPPVVRLSIDDEPISNNGEFTMTRDSTYTIDASGSTDTQNDADNLRYIWRVNNIPTYEGESREISWPEGVDGDFILTLEVMDDDSESSQISILVKDGSADSSLPLSYIALIFSSIFFSYSLINFRKQANESDIPKWS